MDVALRAGVAVLERAVAYCLGSLSLVTPALLSAPTPCRAWDLHALLEHLLDSMAALEEAAETASVTLLPPPSPGGVIPQARDQAVRLLGAWASACDTPFSVRVEHATLSAPLVAGAGAIELAAHGWDVSQSCNRPRPIPDDLADELLDLAVLLLHPADRPGRFARPLPLPCDAPPGARLLAFLGRR
ncbi:TIGR03086 family metal-binding protein [Paractinoplanes durhamensis]|uniref:TIGR03086 family protein n=1 Tax=Paractinoplanes durhamensis TaxID=113563 RepID=A0ABQ3Z372_9ACTN|nr:TIGR03086 family metal-binding protein [Actinoplanes durhamensis]GIE04280.1 TIGR03086 family protein [Actinoplanes durhamensis]